MPTATVVMEPEVALPPLSGLLGKVESGAPLQVGSPGPNRLKVTVPVGLKPPVTVAVSEMEVPTDTARRGRGGDGRGGLGDGHRLGRAGGADRGVVGVTVVGGDPVVGAHGGGREGGARWRWAGRCSALVEVKTGVPAQVASVGGNRLKVTVPVGLKPPLTVAVSEMEVPTTPPAEGEVAMAGVAWVMVTGSAAQSELTAALLVSPL